MCHADFEDADCDENTECTACDPSSTSPGGIFSEATMCVDETEAAEEEEQVVATFGVYPGSETSLVVTGAMLVHTTNHLGALQQHFAWELEGVDPICSAGFVESATENRCGIHIHSGTSCEDAIEVGGHYDNLENGATDPWPAVRYIAEPDGVASGTATVVSGLSAEQVSLTWYKIFVALYSANGLWT